MGVVSWQLAAAAITGFIAKENVVGTLAVCFSITSFINVDELSLEGGADEVAAKMGLTAVSALAYLMFNLFTPPCFAAIGAMNSEIDNKKWFFSGIALQLSVGFTLGYLVNTIGTLIVDSSKLHIGGAIGGGIAVLIIAIIIAYLCIKADKKAKAG